MLIYRTKRINKNGHYRWIIQASANGVSWVIVTNMEGLVPLYHKKAMDVIEALQKKAEVKDGKS